jgi:hypothetical protein
MVFKIGSINPPDWKPIQPRENPRRYHPMRGQKLSEEKKDTARAMLKAGKSYRTIAETLNTSIGTVFSIAKESSQSDLDEMVRAIKKGYADRHLMLANFLLDELATHVNSKTNLRRARNDGLRYDLQSTMN